MPEKMKKWELLPRYAEQPPVIIEAATFEEATAIAEDLARKGHVKPGYAPGGALCPVEAHSREEAR